MNIIRIKIIGFWLLFVLFWLLMYFSWRYRLLWAALFPAAAVFLELIKPRRPRSLMPPIIKTLLWLMVIAFALTVIFHGFLFPHSAVLYLLAKIAFGPRRSGALLQGMAGLPRFLASAKRKRRTWSSTEFWLRWRSASIGELIRNT